MIHGFEHIEAIGRLETDAKDRPVSRVTISHCGELELRKPAARRPPTPDTESESDSEAERRRRKERRREKRERRDREDSEERRERRAAKKERRRAGSEDRGKERSSRKDKRPKEETEEELDARLEREEKERLEEERKAKVEAAVKERERSRAEGGVVYKGENTHCHIHSPVQADACVQAEGRCGILIPNLPKIAACRPTSILAIHTYGHTATDLVRRLSAIRARGGNVVSRLSLSFSDSNWTVSSSDMVPELRRRVKRVEGTLTIGARSEMGNGRMTGGRGRRSGTGTRGTRVGAEAAVHRRGRGHWMTRGRWHRQVLGEMKTGHRRRATWCWISETISQDSSWSRLVGI